MEKIKFLGKRAAYQGLKAAIPAAGLGGISGAVSSHLNSDAYTNYASELKRIMANSIASKLDGNTLSNYVPNDVKALAKDYVTSKSTQALDYLQGKGTNYLKSKASDLEDYLKNKRFNMGRYASSTEW